MNYQLSTLVLAVLIAVAHGQGLLTVQRGGGSSSYGNTHYYNAPASYRENQYQIAKEALDIDKTNPFPSMDVYHPVQNALHRSIQMVCDVMSATDEVKADDLQMRVRRDQCERCFLGTGLPHANPQFLTNFSICAKEFLPDNFIICKQMADGVNLTVDMGEITFTVAPDDDVTRGKFVQKCLHVTCAGIQATNCLDEIKLMTFATPINMTTIDYIYLSECYMRKQAEMDLGDPMSAGLMEAFVRPYLLRSTKSSPSQRSMLSLLGFFLEADDTGHSQGG